VGEFLDPNGHAHGPCYGWERPMLLRPMEGPTLPQLPVVLGLMVCWGKALGTEKVAHWGWPWLPTVFQLVCGDAARCLGGPPPLLS